MKKNKNIKASFANKIREHYEDVFSEEQLEYIEYEDMTDDDIINNLEETFSVEQIKDMFEDEFKKEELKQLGY